MSTKNLNVRLRHAIRTETEWQSSDPILLNGELAFTSDKGLFKVGNGTSKWSELSYNLANSLYGLTVSIAELNYMNGVKSNVQTQLDSKAPLTHAHNEYINQNAFSNIAVGNTTIIADSQTDTLSLVAGDNVTLTPDVTNDKITISAKDTTYNPAGSSLGLVKSGGDVTISDGVITVNDDSHNHTIANVDNLQSTLDGKSPISHTHNYAGSTSSGGSATSAVKLDTSAGSATQPIYFSGGKPVACTYSLNKTVPADAIFTDTTYSEATTSISGLMSSTDKKRIDSIIGSYSLGNMSAKTIADLRTALDTWLSSYCNIANASAYFSASSDWITGWNSGDTTKTISAGTRWSVSIIGTYSAKTYTQLRISTYTNKQVVYVCRTNSSWGIVYSTAFKDDLDSKQNTITGAATTITGSNLTASRVLISNGSGKVTVSSVTSTELGYLSGVTSAIQTQLNGKQPKESTTFTLLDSYVAVRTPNRTTTQYYEFWDSVGWAGIKAGQITASDGFIGNLTGNATSASKVKNALTISLNGTSQGAYDGSSAKSINITPASIGASATSHTHSQLTGTTSADITTAPGTGVLNYKYNVMGSTTGLFPKSNNANAILTFNKHSGNYDSQLGFSSNGNIYYRSFNGSALDTTTAWKVILDSNNYSSYVLPLTGGSLSGNLTLITEDVDRFITFDDSSTGYDWRLEYLGTGGSDANYFVIQSSGTTGTYSNALRFGMTTLDACFGGNIYPSANNSKTLGTSSYKWSTVYATTFSGNATSATTATRVTISNGGTDVERNIVVNSPTDSGQNLFTVPNVTANYSKGTLTASGGFIGNSSTTTKWKTARTITLSGDVTGSVSIDGSANVTLTTTVGDNTHSHNILAVRDVRDESRLPTYFGDKALATFFNNTGMPTSAWYSGIHVSGWNSGSYYSWELASGSTTSKLENIYFRTGVGSTWSAWKTIAFTDSSITGNSATATQLKTSRKINGTSFNGTADITTANWGTARTITIGSTGKSVNGSGNVSWTLAEIGAAASSHSHSYLPLSGGYSYRCINS